MANPFEKANPFSKLLFAISMFLVSIIGSWMVASTMILIVTALFLWERKIYENRYQILVILIYSSLLLIIALPNSTIKEIDNASQLSIRFFLIMYISLFISAILVTRDAILIAKACHLSETVASTFISAARFIPIAMNAIIEILFAQRSRGMKISLRTLLRPDFYRSLVVPYILFIIRNTDILWISTHLRPLFDLDIKLNHRSIRYSIILAVLSLFPIPLELIAHHFVM
jgi:energy-coupling factor transporter transmembrane protein EcfT